VVNDQTSRFGSFANGLRWNYRSWRMEQGFDVFMQVEPPVPCMGKTYDFMNREVTEDNASRLARALIEHDTITYEEAMYRLASLRLHLVCDESIATSTALQAALITAVNVGMRAFHGGVYVSGPANVPSLIPWPGQPMLSDICLSFGAHINQEPRPEELQTIFFCRPTRPGPNALFVSATEWRGCRPHYNYRPGGFRPRRHLCRGARGYQRLSSGIEYRLPALR